MTIGVDSALHSAILTGRAHAITKPRKRESNVVRKSTGA